MKFLLLGSDNFAEPLRRLGMEVWVCGPDPGADLPLAEPDPDWRDIAGLAQARGLSFDAVLVTDLVGARRLATGLWNAPAVTAFYGIDSPLNEFWQTPYAGLFDLALLDQRPQAEALAASHPGAHWLPVGIDPALYEGPLPAQRRSGVCFVGVVDPRLRPKRTAILDKVRKIAPLSVNGGRRQAWFPTADAAAAYREHQVALNENLFPGVTTRPLEIMAAGGCLLSEAAPGAMDLFFRDGEHLFYFTPDDLEQKLELCLRDKEATARAATAGRELVRSRHSLDQRAQELVTLVEAMSKTPIPQRPRAAGGEALRLEGEALLMAGLRWPQEGGERRLLRAAGRLQAAAADGAEPLPAARAAGRAFWALGRQKLALEYLTRAGRDGGPDDALALALAGGQATPSPATRLGDPRAHLDMARLLKTKGRDICPGFNLSNLAPIWWTSLEHLVEAIRLQPGLSEAWEELGDILMARNAPNQAHDAYKEAAALMSGAALEAKLAAAAKQGYLL